MQLSCCCCCWASDMRMCDCIAIWDDYLVFLVRVAEAHLVCIVGSSYMGSPETPLNAQHLVESSITYI